MRGDEIENDQIPAARRRLGFTVGAIFAPAAILGWFVFLGISTDFVRHYATLPLALVSVFIPGLFLSLASQRESFLRGAWKTRFAVVALLVLFFLVAWALRFIPLGVPG